MDRTNEVIKCELCSRDCREPTERIFGLCERDIEGLLEEAYADILLGRVRR